MIDRDPSLWIQLPGGDNQHKDHCPLINPQPFCGERVDRLDVYVSHDRVSQLHQTSIDQPGHNGPIIRIGRSYKVDQRGTQCTSKDTPIRETYLHILTGLCETWC